MPVPRRFDRRPPERDTTRINERIRVPQVRLIGADGEQLGIVDTPEALKRAQDADLDLVEVAPNSKPPVTRLLDYSKYKYEQEQKQKQARKHQQQVNIREIKLRPKIATHDYDTKKGHVERFLKHHDKVKVTIMFRGREQAHPERGRALLQKLFEDLGGIAVVESAPLQEGRNMSMLLAPSKEVDKLTDADAPAEEGAPAEGSAPAPAAEVPATSQEPPATDDGTTEAPADEAPPADEALAEAEAPEAPETPAADASADDAAAADA
ncbi:MAG TPA: translation initiation factor IF-3 [Solirubrobacterales bacterium]|nr:translation initiation factor IF-3 [Solirubrobacterales bacterium]